MIYLYFTKRSHYLLSTDGEQVTEFNADSLYDIGNICQTIISVKDTLFLIR